MPKDRRLWCYAGCGTPNNLSEPSPPQAVDQIRLPTGAGTGSDLAAPTSVVVAMGARLDRVSTGKNASISSVPGNGSTQLRADVASTTDNCLEVVFE